MDPFTASAAIRSPGGQFRTKRSPVAMSPHQRKTWQEKPTDAKGLLKAADYERHPASLT